MSYRPHKRRKATTLEDRCIDLIANNLGDHMGKGKPHLDIKLKHKIMAYLRGSPIMISFPEGFLDEEWAEEGVDISRCELPQGMLEHVGNTVPSLKSINLKQTSGIDMLLPHGFVQLCNSCRQLQSIDLVGATTVSDEMLHAMHKLGGSLRVVRLGGCLCLSSEALARFLEHAGRNLVELDLAGCQVNDFVVKEIVENCHNLRVLSLAYVEDVSHQAWCMLLRSCTRIKSLRLSWAGLSDNLVWLLARHCGDSVEEVDLAGCKTITDESISYLAEKCKQLKTFNIRYCDKITPSMVEKLPSLIKGAQILDTNKG